jgi:hypothetical protein
MKRENTNSRVAIVSRALTVLALATCVAAFTATYPAQADDPPPPPAPGNSTAYGKTLTEWMGIYWRWYYTGADSAQSKVGPVQLMPLPDGVQMDGDWSPNNPALLVGQLEITLPPGTPFVLPEFSWVGELYEDGSEDPPMDDDVALNSADINLTIDGKTIISNDNKAAFYVPPTDFDPIVYYSEPTDYGSVGDVFYQGVAFVGLPLTPGVHVIHLNEPIIIQPGDYVGLPDGLGVIYDNTWTVTVQGGK